MPGNKCNLSFGPPMRPSFSPAPFRGKRNPAAGMFGKIFRLHHNLPFAPWGRGTGKQRMDLGGRVKTGIGSRE